jgi:hypothetical protein
MGNLFHTCSSRHRFSHFTGDFLHVRPFKVHLATHFSTIYLSSLQTRLARANPLACLEREILSMEIFVD